MKAKKIIGGHERKSWLNEDVIKVNFNSEDPSWDVPLLLEEVDKDCKSGKIEDLIIIRRFKDGLSSVWRGKSEMTTGIGMLEYAKVKIFKDTGVIIDE
jgi:hypothetical protein